MKRAELFSVEVDLTAQGANPLPLLSTAALNRPEICTGNHWKSLFDAVYHKIFYGLLSLGRLPDLSMCYRINS